jgi:L-alanine-DL-glutamate epimerase-like enolase superfamily enzyme
MSFNNTIRIAQVDLFAIEVAGGVSPKMALGSMPRRPALLVRIIDSDGCYGWGEVWANFPPRAHSHKAHIIEDVVAPKLVGMSFVEPREVQDQLRDCLSVYFLHVGQSEVFEHILAGLDIAAWDLALRKADVSFACFMQLSDHTAPTYASSINTDDLERLIPQHATLGQTHFKVKIGFLSDDDRVLVERAGSLFPRGTRMMVDSNQMWGLEQAKTSLNWLEQYNPLFAEEPMPANTTLTEWEALANATSIPIAGGENIYGVGNFLMMANAGMKVLQPDVAKWGGVSGALELSKVLPEGTVLWPHFMGSAVGQMAALSVTAAIGGDCVCEMDVNSNSLRTQLCGDVMTIKDGSVALASGVGLVAEPVEQHLSAWRHQ